MRKVLVVGGDADIRELIEDLLFEQGCAVRQAATVDEALLEIRERPFDVLLCHLHAIRAAGGRLAREARTRQPTARLIAMSASGDEATGDEADANLAKPFTRAQLLQALLLL